MTHSFEPWMLYDDGDRRLGLKQHLLISSHSQGHNAATLIYINYVCIMYDTLEILSNKYLQVTGLEKVSRKVVIMTLWGSEYCI